jgi:hypothetical protein
LVRDGFGVLAATIGFGDCRMTWRRAGADAGHNHSAAPLPQRRVRAVLPPALTASLDAGRDGRAQEYKNVGRNAELRNFADISISACGRSSQVSENIAGSGIVQSRVSFSADCQSLAQT